MTDDGQPSDADRPASTMYERVGGAAWFEALTTRFYDGVAVDPVLRPLYPADDLTPARDHLCGFLVQYWGGPTDYSDERGHPRLRMRHVNFAIGPAQRDAWYAHMAESVRAGGLDPADEHEMLGYFAERGGASHQSGVSSGPVGCVAAALDQPGRCPQSGPAGSAPGSSSARAPR